MNNIQNDLIWVSETYDIVYNETIIGVLEVNFKNAEEKVFSDRKLIFTLMPTLALSAFKNIKVNDKYSPNRTENYENKNQILESGFEMLKSLIINYEDCKDNITVSPRTTIDRLVMPTKKCNYELIISRNFQTKIKYVSIMSIGLAKQYNLSVDDKYIFEEVFNSIYNM